MMLPNEFDHVEITDVVVGAARSGDHAAIGALASDAFKTIVSFYRYTGLKAFVAEDLAADAVEKIIAGLPSLKKVASYHSWMWAIARNHLRSHWRQRAREDVVEPDYPTSDGPEELAVIREEHAEIAQAIGTLSLADRELLWLREVMGLDFKEISQRTDMTTGSARVACHRARRRLREAYEAIEEGTA